MMSTIRTIWTMFVGFWTTLFFSLGAIIGGLIGVKKGMYFDGCARYWSWTLLWASGVRVIVEGKENFHRNQPDIVVANHLSWFDIPALAFWRIVTGELTGGDYTEIVGDGELSLRFSTG